MPEKPIVAKELRQYQYGARKAVKPDVKENLLPQAPTRLPGILINPDIPRTVIRSYASPSEDRKRMTERLPPELQASLTLA